MEVLNAGIKGTYAKCQFFHQKFGRPYSGIKHKRYLQQQSKELYYYPSTHHYHHTITTTAAAAAPVPVAVRSRT